MTASGLRCSALVLLALLLRAPLGAGEAVQTINPGFELDIDKDGVPDGWDKSGGGSAKVGLDAEAPKEGQQSVRLETTNFDGCCLRQGVPVERGAVYRASVWVKAREFEPDEGSGFMGPLIVRNCTNNSVVERGQTPPGAADWAQECVDFVAPDHVKVNVEIGWNGKARGALWFDGFRLEQLAPSGGLAALPDPPRGTRILADWAMARNPVDWSSLVAALGRSYAYPDGGNRQWQRGPLASLIAAAGSPAVRKELLRFVARHAWQVDSADLEGRDLTPFLQEAVKTCEGDPDKADLARWARLGLARFAVLSGDGPPEAALTALRQAVGGREAVSRQFVAVLRNDAAYLTQKQAAERAARAYGILLEFTPTDDSQRADVELAHLRFLVACGGADAARKAAEKLAEPGRNSQPNHRQEALRTLCAMAAASAEDKAPYQWVDETAARFGLDAYLQARLHLDFAKALAEKQRWDRAAALCSRAIAMYPQDAQVCVEAQSVRTRCLIDAGQADEALAAAKVAYAVAPNTEQEVTKAVDLVMLALKARYGTLAVANRYADFQAFGPNGKDGKTGTEDDLRDPLADVHVSLPSEADALFKKTLDGLPSGLAGLRTRGYLYLYWGKPDLALKEFAEQYRRSPMAQGEMTRAVDDLIVGLRAVTGHTLFGERFVDYQQFGPMGKDGKLGTGDDLADPVEEALRATKGAGQKPRE